MWILTGILLGSLITSTHDTQELCEGRKAMLSKEKNVNLLDCRQSGGNPIIGYGTSTVCVLTIDGKCR